MAEQGITYTEVKQEILDKLRPQNVVFVTPQWVPGWMCNLCGANVINQDLHNKYHNVGR